MGQRIPFLESAAKWMPEICGFGSMTNGHRGGVVVREKVSTLLASHFKSRSVTSFACWACAPCARITRIKHDASLLWLKKSCALAALGFAVSISASIKFPFITQLKYCQKLDFEAALLMNPINYLFQCQNQLNFLI